MSYIIYIIASWAAISLSLAAAITVIRVMTGAIRSDRGSAVIESAALLGLSLTITYSIVI